MEPIGNGASEGGKRGADEGKGASDSEKAGVDEGVIVMWERGY